MTPNDGVAVCCDSKRVQVRNRDVMVVSMQITHNALKPCEITAGKNIHKIEMV